MGQEALKTPLSSFSQHLRQHTWLPTIFPVPTELTEDTRLQGRLLMSVSSIYRVGRLHEYVSLDPIAPLRLKALMFEYKCSQPSILRSIVRSEEVQI